MLTTATGPTPLTIPDDLDINIWRGWRPDGADPEVIRLLESATRRLILVDIETTGLDHMSGAQVTEICWYSLNSGDGGVFIPRHTLEGADPEALSISRYEERIGGKSQDDGTQLAALHQLLGADGVTTHIVGSNPGFDAGFLASLFARNGLRAPVWHHRLIDPVAAAYWFNPKAEVGNMMGLKNAAEHFGVILDGHHDAAVDVKATAEIYYTLEAIRIA